MTHPHSNNAVQSQASRVAVASGKKHGSSSSRAHQSSNLLASTTKPANVPLRQDRLIPVLNEQTQSLARPVASAPVDSSSVDSGPVDSAERTEKRRLEESSNVIQTASPISETPQKIDILGMDFDNLTPQEFLSSLRKGVVFTPNVDHMMKLRHDPEFVSVYQKADFKICDSQIVMYASRFLGTPLKAKLSGSDLFPWFCDYHKTNDDIRIFLLGGQAGVAKEARARINARIGREIVVGEYSPPFGFEHSTSECDQVVSVIEQSSANVVAVCLGAPKQEKWIAANCDRLPSVDIFMAVGAVVDFEAGAKPRAPRFVSDLGLEWLYRLMCEPRRLWRRYLLEDMPFVGLVLAEKFRRITSSRR